MKWTGWFKGWFKKPALSGEQLILENLRLGFRRDGMSKMQAQSAVERIRDFVGLNRKQRRAYLARAKKEQKP